MGLKPNDSLLNGKYLIEGVLGRGGFGFVYLARDTLLGRPVAIKEMNPTLADDEQMVRRFLVEGRAALQVRHPNVVELYDVFADRGVYYLAMEYCPGGSLDERLAAGPLTLRDALTIMDQVSAGLAHTHSRGIVHCDIKPANILFGADGQAKVTDFGIAHVSPTAVARSWGTSSGFAGGTLTYMAPEQLDGVRDDPRIDVYGLGAVLFKMLTGGSYLDFRAEESISDQIHNALLIKQATPTPPSQRARGIPAWLDGVVLQALSKQPAARFADAGALRAALQSAALPAAPVSPPPVPRAAGQQPPKTVILPPAPQARSATPPAAPHPAARPAPPWLWLAAGGMTVLILLAVALAAVLSRGGASTPTPLVIATTAAPGATPTTPPVVMVQDTATATWTFTPVRLTDTPTPIAATATPVPPRPLTTTPTRTPHPTATPTATPEVVVLPAPVLTSPQERATGLMGKVRFAWDYAGALQPGQAFEVRIWAQGQDHLGAVAATTALEQMIDLDFAPGITSNRNAAGEYLWAVAVINRATGKAISRESEPRHFNYTPPRICEGTCR